MPTSSTALLHRIIGLYGLQAADIAAARTGYRNHNYCFVTTDGQLRNLILYKREPGMAARIARLHYLGSALAASGLPARQPVDERIVRLSAGNHTSYAGLYTYLPGATIPWESYSRHHIKLLGKALGLLHRSLATLPGEALNRPQLPSVIAEQARLAHTMRSYFDDHNVQQALAYKLKLRVSPSFFNVDANLLELCRHLSADTHLPLHMDFVRGNILFSDQRTANTISLDQPDKGPYISGILDLEKAAAGPPVFDLARTLAFLLVDCKHKPAAKIRAYFLESGYHKRGKGQLDSRQLSLLPLLTRHFMMYDFYKFLCHNPYEALPDNEHFVRTRDILLKDGIIKPISGSTAGH